MQAYAEYHIGEHLQLRPRGGGSLGVAVYCDSADQQQLIKTTQEALGHH